MTGGVILSFNIETRNLPKIRKPTDLRCEYSANPVGIDVLRPRFSWVLIHLERGHTQSAYQILVASTRESLLNDMGDIWDSGKVESGSSVNVPYEGKPLESKTIYHWKVRWWDDNGQVSPFSEIASFETGLFTQNGWAAKWIGGGDLLRTSFVVDRSVRRARAYVCGLGYYELRINGKKAGEHVLDPGWTDYEKLALYSAYDIDSYLLEGENAVGVMLGNGRYIKQYGYGPPKVILQLDLQFMDGRENRIVTDEAWRVSKSPIIENGIFNGETYDARLEKEGWDSPGYDDSKWEKAKIAKPPGGRMVSQATFPPIKAVKMIQPVSISNPKPGVYVYDFGQNFTGWARLTVCGPRGTEVKLRYAELRHYDEMINQIPNRTARATDTYILKGEGIEVYEPRFTYHGFRYVEVTGFPGIPNLDAVQGVVVHSAVEPVGRFQCSNQLINRIHQNVLWGQSGNLMSIPTDCTQRDERMGWLGDAQVTAEEAIYNFDMPAFYTKWLRDIKEAQKQNGSIPDLVPPYLKFYPADPAWGTACIIIPWYLYLYYADKRILEESYPVMKGWVDFLTTKSEGYIVKYGKFGDWCRPAYPRSLDTPRELVSTWYYYHDTLMLSRIAHVLGKSAEAKKYNKLSEKINEAFNHVFLREDHYLPDLQLPAALLEAANQGVLDKDHYLPDPQSLWTHTLGSQTSSVLPLYLDMVPADKKEAVLKRLVADIEIGRGCHIVAGIIGTRYLLDTLTNYGRSDLAYRLAAQTTYPSWGFMIREGATTLWERWEYLDGTVNSSHNHIMFGSVDAWFYKVLAGISPDPSAPGFEKVIIKPYVVGNLSHVSASLKTIRGLISSSWRREENSLAMEVTLPVNSKGKVNIPALGLRNPVVRESGEVIYKDNSFVLGVPGITSGRRHNEYIAFDVGAGSYSFRIEEPP